MSRLFRAVGEDRTLDADTRRRATGTFVALSDGITQCALAGPPGRPVVVLLPGLTVPLEYWSAMSSELHRRGFRTLAYSAYGRGWSDRVDMAYDQQLFLRQLIELLRATVDDEEIHLVATSMGALIALAFATTPDAPTPRSLTLIGPAGLSKRPPVLGRLLSVEPLGRGLGKVFGRRVLMRHLAHNVSSDDDVARLSALVGEPFRIIGSTSGVLSTLRDFPLTEQHHLYRRSASLGLPTQLIWGELDQVTPIAQLDTAQTLLAPNRVHVLPDRGHMVPFEDPHAAGQLVADFLYDI